MVTQTLLYRVIVTDKNGKIEKRTHWKKSRSFVLGWNQLIQIATAHSYNVIVTNTVIKDTSGANQTCGRTAGSELLLGLIGEVNNANYGLVIGTGANAVSNIDNALQTPIANGVGAGQMVFSVGTYIAAGVSGSNVDFILSRTFLNSSGGTITVNEIGAVAATANNAVTEVYILVIHDLATVAVNNTKTLTVQYTLRTTV